jgi:hypothetical protein
MSQMRLVVFAMKSRIFGTYFAAIDRIVVSVMKEAKPKDICRGQFINQSKRMTELRIRCMVSK